MHNEFAVGPAVGVGAVVLIAGLARWARALTNAGTVAALVVGVACVLADGRWAVLLVAFFVSSTLLSRIGAGVKAGRAGDHVAKPGARDAAQVAANGGVFAALAIASAMRASPALAAATAGALAAATADTWATEVGLLRTAPPRLITTLQTVTAGTSGGVTITGTAAGAAGALMIAGIASAMGTQRAPGAVAVGGVAGMLADSLLGATVQARRRCPRCNAATERRTHVCGTTTELTGGVGWIDNDVVNALATCAGAVVAAVLG